MKRATSDSLPLELHCLQNSWAVFATADHEKEKVPASWHQYYFSAFFLPSPQMIQCHQSPASVQCNLNPQPLSQKNQRYRPLFMIHALFLAWNLINSYINSSVLGGASWVFQFITQIDRCSQIRWGLRGTSITSLRRIFPIQTWRTHTALYTCQHLSIIGVNESG